ncbi:MAG: hypothetical protein ACRC0V_00190 [Fusobacteriaceae bacterium]
MIKIIIFILFVSNLFGDEISYFRPSLKYEIKDPIAIESNMDTIDFGTVIHGNTAVVSGHNLKITGTGNMNITSGFSRNINGIQIVEKKKQYRSTGELEVEYQYIWDTSKSDVKDLSGTRVTFTAYYE